LANVRSIYNAYVSIENSITLAGGTPSGTSPSPTSAQPSPTQTPITTSQSNVTVVPIYLVPSGVTAQSSGGLSSGVAAAQQFYAAQTGANFRTGALQVRNSSHDAKWFCGDAEKANCSTSILFNQVLAEVGEGPAGTKYLVFLSGVQDLSRGVPNHEHARAYIGGNLAVFGDLPFQALNGGSCGIYSDHCGSGSAMVAHELGHNFGIDGDYGGCGTCLMAIPVTRGLSQLTLTDSEKTTVRNHLTGPSGMLPNKNRQLASEDQQLSVLGTKDENKAENKIPVGFDFTKFSQSIVEFII